MALSLKSHTFYWLLILSANIGLLIPPLRFAASLLLISFLPGYLLVERMSLWKNPLFAAIGSIGCSFLLSPVITLPGCILFQKVNAAIIALSLDLFLLGMLFSFKNRKRIAYQEKNHSPLLAPLLILICSWVFIYLDIAKLGPYAEDWAYLFGIFKELSRNMPPQDPEASFLLLKYPWGFYFFYALIHRLGGISAWNTLEFVPVLLSFVYLGMVYMILFQATRMRTAGLWAIVFLTIGRQTEWVWRGLQGLGWHPGWNNDLAWSELQTFTGYSLLWAWYLPASVIPPLITLFFLIRYQQEQQKKDYWVSLGACSISCFFHPAYYLGFLIGFSCWLFFQWLRKRFDPWLFLFFFAFIPYFLTFYLYFRPSPPADPFFQFFHDKTSLIHSLREYWGNNGIAIPFAVWALLISREARIWLFPFAGPFVFLSTFGQSGINPLSHFVFPGVLYLSMLSAVGLEALKKIPWVIRLLIYGMVLVIITLPFFFQVSHRLEIGWEGAADSEEKAAGVFIRSNTVENSTFVTFPNSRYSTTCVEGLGERKVVFGWFFHLNRYETVDFLNKRAAEVYYFYLTSDIQTRKNFIRRYRADYVFLGPDEINFMREHKTDIKRFTKDYQTVYKSENIEILKVDEGKP